MNREIKKVRTSGPAYDFNMKTFSFFNPGFYFLAKIKLFYCKNIGLQRLSKWFRINNRH